MRDDDGSTDTTGDAQTIARNLRHYANAGTTPNVAAKLLAVALELDALAAQQKRPSAEA
ncbi:MAG TPA: hypothetical protein VGC36_02045 [Rhizomicrobium sp.]